MMNKRVWSSCENHSRFFRGAQKRATQGWTMTKLISFILLIIILILVIYGVSQKQMKPLIDRVGARVDDVLIWLGLRDDDSAGLSCFTEKAFDFSEGPEFIEKMGFTKGQERSVDLTLCTKGICWIKGALGSDRVYAIGPSYAGLRPFFDVTGYDMVSKSVDALKQSRRLKRGGDYFEMDDLDLAKKERDIYRVLYSKLPTDLWSSYNFWTLRFRVDDSKTDRIRRDFIYWKKWDGWYHGEEGGKHDKMTWGDDEALKEIYDNSRGSYIPPEGDDKVYWDIRGDGDAKDVYKESVIPGMSVDEGEIENDKDFGVFNKFFRDRWSIVSKDRDEKIAVARKVIGDTVFYDGKDYELKVEKFDGKDIFFIEGDFGKYGLYERSSNLYLYKFVGGKWGSVETPHDFIKIGFDDAADYVLRLSRIYKFLKSRCGE